MTPLTEFPHNDYLAYPHCNGFLGSGDTLILGRLGLNDVSLVRHEIQTGKQSVLCTFSHGIEPDKRLWFEVAEKNNLLVTISQNAIWLYDLNTPGSCRKLYSGTDEWRLHPLPGISIDGSRVLAVIQSPSGHSKGLQIDVKSGTPEILFEKPWLADHVHFCPHDETWIGFSHEGACATIPDRVWGWHREAAPEAKCFFDQHPNDPPRCLYAGHERWCYRDTSALVVAYGDGPGTPRGIYETFTDGRPTQLVSEGNRDWHVNGSRDGKWAVADTTGPHDLPGKGWEKAEGRSSVLLIDMKTGARTFLSASRIGQGHAHPHPVFSPDGRSIFFNESNADGTLNRVCKVENPLVRG